jgi:hypothetical protein
MKIPLIVLFLCCSMTLYSQKVRLEGDSSRYLCLNDSIAATFKKTLDKEKVDSTISILYDYDNGRLPDSRQIIIWTHNGTGRIRIIDGCDRIEKDTAYSFNVKHLWDYIAVTKFDDLTVPISQDTISLMINITLLQ